MECFLYYLEYSQLVEIQNDIGSLIFINVLISTNLVI